MVHRALSLVIAIAGSATIALAASVLLSTDGLGAGSATTARCTSSGLSVIQTLSGSNVASVAVSGIPAVCGGAALSLTVNNGTASATGSATVPAGGGSVTVTLTPAIAATTVEQTDLVLVGP